MTSSDGSGPGRARTDALKARVARHFAAPEWFTTFEFPVGSRQLDALAVSRIESRGNELVGIEVKTDRSDWLHELAQPWKADRTASVLDRFYLVAGNAVAKEAEVPSTWGFLEDGPRGLRQRRVAPLLTSFRTDRGVDPVSRELWVRIIRRTLDAEALSGPLKAEYDRGREAGVKESNYSEKRRADSLSYELERIKKGVREFEASSGIKIDDWGMGRVGEFVKAIGEYRELARGWPQEIRNLRRMLDDLEAALQAAAPRIEVQA